MNSALVMFAMIFASVVLPVPGGPQKMIERSRPLDRTPQGLAGPEQMLLARRTRRACADACEPASGRVESALLHSEWTERGSYHARSTPA